jgi:hypothetical protein
LITQAVPTAASIDDDQRRDSAIRRGSITATGDVSTASAASGVREIRGGEERREERKKTAACPDNSDFKIPIPATGYSN